MKWCVSNAALVRTTHIDRRVLTSTHACT